VGIVALLRKKDWKTEFKREDYRESTKTRRGRGKERAFANRRDLGVSRKPQKKDHPKEGKEMAVNRLKIHFGDS